MFVLAVSIWYASEVRLWMLGNLEKCTCQKIYSVHIEKYKVTLTSTQLGQRYIMPSFVRVIDYRQLLLCLALGHFGYPRYQSKAYVVKKENEKLKNQQKEIIIPLDPKLDI